MVMTNKGYAVLFGGYVVIYLKRNIKYLKGDGFTNEVYFLDLVAETWSRPLIDGRAPLPRESFTLSYVSTSNAYLRIGIMYGYLEVMLQESY